MIFGVFGDIAATYTFMIQSNILYMKEIGDRLFLITNFTAKVACLCRKQIHFFCVKKAGRGNKKKMVIFIVVIYCLTFTDSKH